MFKKLKKRVTNQWHELFEEITVVEYIFWWITRICLLCSVIFAHTPEYRSLDTLNFIACFTMSVLRFIAPRRSFLARIDFRCQHAINLFELLGIFGGHLLNAYAYIPKFDRILHLISGPITLLVGYYIYKAFESAEGKKKYYNPTIGTFCAAGFSFLIIVAWEIQEFISDFFIGSQNQGYYYVPPQDDLFFKIFGTGANGGEGQFPLWDTMLDMIDATLTTVLAIAVLYISLSVIKKRALKKEALLKQEETVESC